MTTDAERWLPLSPLEFHVLVALTSGPSHGYAILKDAARRSEGRVEPSASTLYGIIARLDERGLIEEVRPSPIPHDDQARRRYYRLTDLGRRVGRAEMERLERLLSDVPELAFGVEPGTA